MKGWGAWGGALVLGTLREQVLVFMLVSHKFEVLETVQLDMGERIRDLELTSDGAIIATTNSENCLPFKTYN